MKAYIGAGVAGALALAGVIGLTMRTSAPVQASPEATGVAGLNQPADAQQPILVNCGEGRQAMVRQTLVGDRTVSRVECVPDASLLTSDAPTAAASSFAVPGQQLQAPVAAPPAQPRTRVVYRDRPVYREREVERPVTPTSTAPSTTTTASNTSGGYGDSGPGSRREEARKPGRSWQKTAIIIGGSTAGGAGVGAVLGGRRGAAKGAVLGGIAGTIYDVATRNRDTHR